MTEVKEVDINNDADKVRHINDSIRRSCIIVTGLTILYAGTFCYLAINRILGVSLITLSVALPIYLKFRR